MSKRMISVAVVMFSLLVMSFGSGCSRNLADANASPSPSPTGAPYDPNTYPTPAPVYTPDPIQTTDVLIATIDSHGTTGILIWKKAKGTIAVNNPSQETLSGTLSIAFTHNKQTVETQQQAVTLGAGETKKIDVKATKNSEDLSVTIAPDNSQPLSNSVN